MNTVTSIVSVFPETKTEIKSFSEQLIKSVIDGNADPLRAKVQLSAMKKVIETVEKDSAFNTAVLNEASKYHKEELQNIHNSSIQVKETCVKYDYSECGCHEYDRLCTEIENLTARKKGFEKMLQTIPEGFMYTDTETGEISELNKPTKTSTTSVVVTINK